MIRRQFPLVALLLLLATFTDALPAGARLRRRKQRQRLLREGSDAVDGALQSYLSNTALEHRVHEFAKRCKKVARLHNLGSSVEGRPLWALELSENPGKAEAKPHVKYVGGVHGDEPTGRVLGLALAEWLCANYKSDSRARRVITGMHLWILPAMNPDGFQQRSRENKNGVDLNRDFPDRFSPGGGLHPSGKEQPETQAIMRWALETPFVASASMHEGALVANYPWDGTPDRSTAYTACPDDAAFKHLATVFAKSHHKMSLPTNREFPNGGTTNGAAWYPVYGSMQDWNYIIAGCMELTLELSYNKWPEESLLPSLWDNNRDALLAFPLAAAFGGIWGTVMDGKLRRGKLVQQGPLGEAVITVLGINRTTVSGSQFGDFYRPLAPGAYRVLVSKQGYQPLSANVTVPTDGSGAEHHFVLHKLSSKSSSRRGALVDGMSLQQQQAGQHSTLNSSLALLVIGAAVVQGLWLTHQRLLRRGHRS